MADTLKDKDFAAIKVLPKKATGTVAIFSHKDFYRCYGDDAVLIANEILMSNVGLQIFKADSGEVCYQNLNNAQYSRVVRDLLLLFRYRLELYEFNDGTKKYYLKSKGVLGNLTDFEDIVSEHVELSELSTVMCAHIIDSHLTDNIVTVAFCNSQEMRIVVSEFQDTQQFTLLENTIISLQPHECIVFKDDSLTAPERFKHLESALKRSNLTIRVLNEVKKEFDERKLLKMFNKNNRDINLTESNKFVLNTLLSEMELFQPNYEGFFSLMHHQFAGYMYLSNATVQALEIFSPCLEEDRVQAFGKSTLYDQLNKCRSQPGKRLLREWMKKPLYDLRQIEERLNVVETLITNHSIRQMLHESFLRTVPDISHIIRRFSQGKAGLQDCYRIYQFYHSLQKLDFALREIAEEISESCRASVRELIHEPVKHSIIEFKNFIGLVDGTIDVKYYEQYKAFRIKPEIDGNLSRVDQDIKESEMLAGEELEKLIDQLQCDGIKLDSSLEHGFFFRVTLKSEKVIRGDKSLRIMSATKGEGVRFQNFVVEKINYKYKELQAEYEKAQVELSKAVVKICSGYVQALHALTNTVGVIDVLTAFSVIAISSEYSRPKILEKGTSILELEGCRHPVIETLSNIHYIPNSLCLGVNYDDNRFIVLTGANMGGKSTYLRATALTIFMGQIGSYVPCTSATFSLVDGIYTRIGASDYQFKGVSTFMAEMTDSSIILERATQNSLILIDELGRGTSTYDGFGLAWAIAEDIILRVNSFCLFATHFHELSKLERRYPREVKNFKMDTLIDDDGKLTILYQVVQGVADRSFGLCIAKLVGIDENVIQDAEDVLKRLQHEQASN